MSSRASGQGLYCNQPSAHRPFQLKPAAVSAAPLGLVHAPSGRGPRDVGHQSGINSDARADADRAASCSTDYDADDSDAEFFGAADPPVRSKHFAGKAITKKGRPRAPYTSHKRHFLGPHESLPAARRNCELDRVAAALCGHCCGEEHLSRLTPEQVKKVRTFWADQGSRQRQKAWLVEHLRDSVRTRRAYEPAPSKRVLEYRLPLSEWGNPRICERGFLIVFGLGQHGLSENMLSQARNHVLHGTPLAAPRYPARNNPQQTQCMVWLTRYVENLDRVGEDSTGHLYHMHQYLLWSSLYEAACRDLGKDGDPVPSSAVFHKIRRLRFPNLHRPNKGTYGRCTTCGKLWRQAEDAFYENDREVHVQWHAPLLA